MQSEKDIKTTLSQGKQLKKEYDSMVTKKKKKQKQLKCDEAERSNFKSY